MSSEDKYSCKNCANYKGDCGHHFYDSNGHINFEIPSESMFDGVMACYGAKCWQPNDELIERAHKKRIQEIMNYGIDDVKEAFEILQSQNSGGDS